MDLRYIGEKIRQRRKELGLTLVQLQEETGISNGNLSDMERGKSAPSAKALLLLSNTLQCTPNDLLLKDSRISVENFSLLSDSDAKLLDAFHNLNAEDQQEVIEYIEFRAFRSFQQSKKKSRMKQEISSPSIEKNDAAGTA